MEYNSGMHPVFTRPWSIGTSLIVVVLVLGIPTVLLKIAFGYEFTVDWPMVLGILGQRGMRKEVFSRTETFSSSSALTSM